MEALKKFHQLHVVHVRTRSRWESFLKISDFLSYSTFDRMMSLCCTTNLHLIEL